MTEPTEQGAIEGSDSLERAGTEAESIGFFTDPSERFPDDSRVVFAHAEALDDAGQEHDATTPYPPSAASSARASAPADIGSIRGWSR